MDSGYIAFLVYNSAVLFGVLVLCTAAVPAVLWAVAARRCMPARRPRRFVSCCAAVLVLVAIVLVVSSRLEGNFRYYPPIQRLGADIEN
jgi:hypothetical protein